MVKSYCIREKKQTDSNNEQFERANNGRLMLKSICASCGGKKSKFIKNVQHGGFSDALFEHGMKGLFNGSKLVASYLVKSDFAKRKMKNVTNKYLDQMLDSVTSDISDKLNPLEGSGFDIHKLIGKLPRPKGGFTPGKYKSLLNDVPYVPTCHTCHTCLRAKRAYVPYVPFINKSSRDLYGDPCGKNWDLKVKYGPIIK